RRTRWHRTSSTEENRVSALRMRKLVAIIGNLRRPVPPAALAPPTPCGRSPRSPPSMHVAPVFLLEQPGEEREERQEQHDPDAEGLALEHGRLAGILEESGDVAHG